MAKILLVEDDNNLREIYEARLQAEGYTIVSARDGEEALVIAKGERPDLVISDVMMPKISGFEMLDILRNTDGMQHVKVIMLTALGQSEDQKRADSLGADRYLVKSQVTLEDIVNVSHELLVAAGAIEGEAPATAPVETVAPTPAAADTPVAVAPVEPVVEPAPAIAVSPEPAPTVIPVATSSETEAGTTPVSVIPEPVAATEPPTAPVEPPTDDAVSSAQEEAKVQEQIESFVADQPGTAPTEVEPTTDPVNLEPEVSTPETPAPPSAASETLPTTGQNSTSLEQEQALADALANLSDPNAPATPPASTNTVEEQPEEGTGTHKKVIQPLSDPEPNKKSLQELLAEEEAKEAGAVPPVAPVTPPVPETPAPAVEVDAVPPVAEPTSAEPAPKPAPGKDDFDPNSIAL